MFKHSNNQKGFTLVEVMVVAGMVAGLSLAIMQMTSNANKAVKKMSQDTEVLQLVSDVQFAMRDKAKCGDTLNGKIVTDAVSAGGSPPQSVLGTTVASVIKNITPPLTAASVGTEYGKRTPGAFTVTDIRLQCPLAGCVWTALAAPAVNKSDGAALLRIYITKGHLNSSAEIQKTTSLGSLTYVRDVIISKVTVNSTTQAVLECFSDDDSYVQAACTALGGLIDTDGYCKGIDIAPRTQTPVFTDDPNVAATFQGGNVGIGTTTVINKLHIFDGSAATSSLADNNDFIRIRMNSANNSYGVLESMWDNNPAIPANIAINPNGGFVGIGTTTVTDTLTIVPRTAITNGAVDVATTFAGPFFSGRQLGAGYASPNAIFNASTANPTGSSNFFYKGTTSGTLTSSIRADGQGYFAGNVGIGTTVPLRSLDIENPTNSAEVVLGVIDGLANNRKWNLVVNGGTGIGQSLHFRLLNDAGTGGTVAMTMTPTGNVGIGTTVPTEKLTVFGNIDTNQSAALIGAYGSNNNRYVTKDWVIQALNGGLDNASMQAQREAMINYILNSGIAGSRGDYTTLRNAILASIEVQPSTWPVAAATSTSCAGAGVVKGIRYLGSSGTFEPICGAETNPPDCTVSGNCNNLFANNGFCIVGSAWCITAAEVRLYTCTPATATFIYDGVDSQSNTLSCPNDYVLIAVNQKSCNYGDVSCAINDGVCCRLRVR